jgi:hypothetical protein
MSTRLGDRLRAARQRQFVGREQEKSLFLDALRSSEPRFAVLYVYGPGGVGKTTLLKEFARLADAEDVASVYLDAHNIEASTESFVASMRAAMGIGPGDNPVEAAARFGRFVLMVDTYEVLVPLDGWLRETFLPELPENATVVFGSRQPPSPAWRSDEGWQSLLRVAPLRNLSPDESRDYLRRRNIPEGKHAEVLNFTHGHPLALSLVADVFAQRGDVPFTPEVAPDVVRTLLEQLVQKVPGPAHRSALEACALVRLTTEELLAEMLHLPEARDLFDWLRGLSFIESGSLGIFPHDLAREALMADLRWRNPAWYNELHRRARSFYTERVLQSHGPDQQRHLFDLIFLHRENAMVRPFMEWQESGTLLPGVALDEDMPAVLAMVRHFEGDESAALVERWRRLQPGGLLVYRDPDGVPTGMLMLLSLGEAAQEDIEADPAASAAWRYLQRAAPLRAGEAATHFRFWMARDTYQDVSGVQSVILLNIVRHYLMTRGLVFTFYPVADPDFWAPLCAYGEIERLPECDYEVGGKSYGVFGHNWRNQPPAAWLAMLADKETAVGADAIAPPKKPAPLVVLSEQEFAAAVRDALRDLTRPVALRANTLLQSRLVTERAGADAGAAERVTALQAAVRAAAERIQGSSKDEKLYRALYRTYIQPADTQERAAELLDMPFSTYRRHLKMAIERAAETMWRWELQGLDP